MGDLSTAALAEMFKKRLVVLEKLENSEKLRTPTEAPAMGLLRLPIEIRLQIYYHCIPRNYVVDVTSPCLKAPLPFPNRTLRLEIFRGKRRLEYSSDSEDDDVYTQSLEDIFDPIVRSTKRKSNRSLNSIFLLSRQISEEALNVLYGENVFRVNLHGHDEYHFKNNFTDRNRQRMRYLLLVARPMGVSYSPGKTVDDAPWCSMLPHLKGLRMVLEQPVEEPEDYYLYDAPSIEQDIKYWVNWLRPILQYLGQHLPMQTKVEVDCDGRAETGALIKECIPHAYQEIRCRDIGDLIFKRGRFTWESEYWYLPEESARSADWDADRGSD